jgi:two-component system, NarL family, invasion response regulator UvrY
MRVFLVDAHPIFREGLKSVMRTCPDLKIIGEAEKCPDALGVNPDECDVYILDGELDSLVFLAEISKTRRKGQPPFILILSRQPEDQYAIRMLKAGADGYLNKSRPPSSIIEAVRKLARGRKYVSKELAEAMLLNFDNSNNGPHLSDREYEVLNLFASGLGMTQIAERLSLSVKTVSTYRCRLLEKLNLHNNAELMRYAFKEGLLS